MSDHVSEPPELTTITNTKLDWTVATKEGNKLCTHIQKMIKNIKDVDTFRTEMIYAMNEFLNTIFDIINNKVPSLEEQLELKGLDQLHRPDWGRAFMTNEELRSPIRSPDNIKTQLTDMETKIQLILARIPKTEDFVSDLKKEFKNGTLNTEDEFLRVQNGLRHVTHRMDEIEEFRVLWKQHKDPLTSLLKKKNVPFNARPNDIAGIRLYQFINMSIGTPCYQVITLNGWPTTEEWKGWEAWWNIQMQRIADHEAHLGIKSVSSAWPMQVAHTTAMIMQTVNEINIAAAVNIAQIKVEPLIWKLAFIKNALTELFIIPKTNDTGWFANIWTINDKILKKKPNVKEMTKFLATIIPARIPEEHIIHVSTPAKDLIPIHNHELVVATTSVPVPRIRNIPDNYRTLWDEKEKENIPPQMTHPKKEKRPSTAKHPKKPVKKAPKKPLRNPPSLKKRKVTSSSESSAEEPLLNKTQPQEDDSSSEDDLEKNRMYIGSSSSEDEDFNMYYE